MGQEQSVQNGSQRIKPTPGSSGLRRRRGTISIYSESNSQIHTLKITPQTTVKEILSMFSEYSQLKLGDTILTADTLLADLESAVFRLVDDQSTVGSSNGSVELRPIGPRPFDQRPEKPVNQSSILASFIGDEPCEMNLTAIAVPDVRLRKKLRPTKSLYQLIQV